MLTNVTVADVLRPCEKNRALFYDIALIIGGSMLIALCARFKFFLPFSRVPVTAQTLAVLMIGALFGSRRGCLAALAYVIAGTAGLPIFSTGGGLAVLRGFSGGYLVGFAPAAFLTGRLAEKGWDRRIATTVPAMVLGNIVIYAFGLAWLSCLPGVNVLREGLFPFILGDLLKIVLAAIALPSGWKLLGYAGLAEKRK